MFCSVLYLCLNWFCKLDWSKSLRIRRGLKRYLPLFEVNLTCWLDFIIQLITYTYLPNSVCGCGDLNNVDHISLCCSFSLDQMTCVRACNWVNVTTSSGHRESTCRPTTSPASLRSLFVCSLVSPETLHYYCCRITSSHLLTVKSSGVQQFRLIAFHLGTFGFVSFRL